MTANTNEIVYQKGAATDEEIREGRQMVLVSEALASSGEARMRAEWQRNIDTARGNVYSASLDGYRNQTGELWSVNTLPHVISDYAGLDMWMLIDSVSFGFSLHGGRSTTLGMVASDTYKLEADTPDDTAPNRKKEKGAFGWISQQD